MTEKSYLRMILLGVSIFTILVGGGFTDCDCEDEEVEELVARYAVKDSDQDGIPDRDETFYFNTDPFDFDTDDDGLSDWQEIAWDGDSANYTPGQDTDPLDPDTDDDGSLDGLEADCGADPLDPNDPIIDTDWDFDGLAEWLELCLSTDPNNPYSDGDLWPDGFELQYDADPADEDDIPEVEKVVINEVWTGNAFWFELYNVGSEPVDLTGWSYQVYFGFGPSVPLTFGSTWGEVSIGPRELIVFDTEEGTDTPGRKYAGVPVLWCDLALLGGIGGGAVAIYDDSGNGHDYVRWGRDGADGPPWPTGWNEEHPLLWECPPGDTLRRDLLGTDTDTEDDWKLGFPTPGQPNSPDPDDDCLSTWDEDNVRQSDSGDSDTDNDSYIDGLETALDEDPGDAGSFPSEIIPEIEPNNAWASCTPISSFDREVIGTLCPSSYPTDGLTPIFVEDFSDGEYTDTFQNHAGGWKQVMAMGGHDTALCARSYPNDVHLFTNQWFGDAIIEFDYYMEYQSCDGGFFVRAQNSGAGYLISVDAIECEGWPVEWEAYRRQGGSWPGLPVRYRQPQRIGYSQWRHYKVVTEGNRIIVFEDGRLLGYFEDSQWATGGVGLRAIDGSTYGRECIDNIVVYPLAHADAQVDPKDDGFFFDDFADGDHTDTFMGLSTGGVTEIKRIGNHGTALCARGQGGNVIHSYTKQSFGDGVLEFDYYQATGNPYGGVFLRTQTNRHAYLIEFPLGGQPWKAWRMWDGGWTQIWSGTFATTTIQTNRWTHLKVVMEGGRFDLYEDGNYRGYFIDTRFYDQGGVGIRGVHGETCIDNLSFRPLQDHYLDDFSDFDVSDTFSIWDVNAEVKPIGPDHLSALCAWGNGSNNIPLYTNQRFGDVIMEFDYYIENGGGFNDGGVFLRVHDSDNGYLISLDAGDWQAYRRWGGGWTGLGIGNKTPLSLSHYEWRHYEIHMTGGWISLYEDGEYRGYFQDYHYQRGGIGLRGLGSDDSAETCIDNLRVTPLIPDTNYYCVDAQAGQALAFNINAEEYKWPVDAHLTLYGIDGTTVLARSHDACDAYSGWCGDDPFLPYMFPADGVYYLAVEGAGWGREACHVYDLEVHQIAAGDTDGDGLPDWEELTVFFTDPFEPDSDFDGLNDYDEINYDGDDTGYVPPQLGNPFTDTDPWNPDTDGDTLSDGDEVSIFGTHPLLPDSDGDGLIDPLEIAYDGDAGDYTPGQDTDPNNPDTDGDGWPDGMEVLVIFSDPLDPDDPPGNNFGFELGDFTSWAPMGEAQVLEEHEGISPSEGSYMGFISTDGNAINDEYSLLMTFNALGPGETGLSFDYDFLTDESTPESDFNDYFEVFVSVNGGPSILVLHVDTWSVFFPVPSGSDIEHTDWQTYIGGPYPPGALLAITFVVSDVGDTAVFSGALVDNLQFF